MVKSLAKYLFSAPGHKTQCTQVQLLRVILEGDFTRVNMGCQATSYYTKGGWIRIAETTFIQVLPAGMKLKMIGTENIPKDGTKHELKSTKDWLYFSLFFPAIPFKTCKVNLIEKENSTGNDFNFYDIELKISEAIKLL
jgi:hypothetical protein